MIIFQMTKRGVCLKQMHVNYWFRRAIDSEHQWKVMWKWLVFLWNMERMLKPKPTGKNHSHHFVAKKWQFLFLSGLTSLHYGILFKKVLSQVNFQCPQFWPPSEFPSILTHPSFDLVWFIFAILLVWFSFDILILICLILCVKDDTNGGSW